MQSLPLLGGRTACEQAAGILEILCSPAPAPASTAGVTGSAAGKDAKSAKPARAASASSSSAASAASGNGGDAGLTASLQKGVLAAGGLPALLKVRVVAAKGKASAQTHRDT